jgi:hypothetical protein
MPVSTRRRPDWPPFFVSRFCRQFDELSRRKADVKRLGKPRYLKTDVAFCANDRLPHRHDQRDAEQRDDDDPLDRSEAGVPARMNSPLEISGGIRGDVDLGASDAGEVLLSHLSVRAVEAIRLLMIDLLDLETLMKVIPSAWTTVPFAIRARMNDLTWLSASKLPEANCRHAHRNNLALTGLVPGQNDGHVTRPR